MCIHRQNVALSQALKRHYQTAKALIANCLYHTASKIPLLNLIIKPVSPSETGFFNPEKAPYNTQKQPISSHGKTRIIYQ